MRGVIVDKFCHACGKRLPLSRFAPSQIAHGRSGWCRDCDSARLRRERYMLKALVAAIAGGESAGSVPLSYLHLIIRRREARAMREKPGPPKGYKPHRMMLHGKVLTG